MLLGLGASKVYLLIIFNSFFVSFVSKKAGNPADNVVHFSFFALRTLRPLRFVTPTLFLTNQLGTLPAPQSKSLLLLSLTNFATIKTFIEANSLCELCVSVVNNNYIQCTSEMPTLRILQGIAKNIKIRRLG
ncbi:hypothetical protein CAL7102_09079 [Dulcicalothrix desertica PCC 7102]|nr:hypothetical protein CAL7102_09079 [Dulcicalothrix desertica PCC 7102]